MINRTENLLGSDTGCDPLAVTPLQAARMLGCARNTIYALVEAKRLRAVRFGEGGKSKIRIPIKAIEEFLQSASDD